MNLQLTLKRAGIITGPKVTRETRHSELSVIKAFLLGRVFFVSRATQKTFDFGSAVHETYLIGGTKRKLDAKETPLFLGMLNSLNRHPIARKLFADTVREKRVKWIYEGVKFGGTPDARKPGIINDLKTTACTNGQDFLKKAFEYGYFRQGVTYMIAVPGVKEFFIVGISKTPPHPVFVVLIQRYPDLVRYAKEELKFLTYFYKNYGTPKGKK